MVTAIQVKRQAQRAIEKQRERAAKVTPKTITPLKKFAHKYFRHFLTTPESHFHIDLAPDLDAISANRGSKVARIAPRGSAKSTWSTLINVLKCALEGTERYIVIISDIQPNANKFLKAIKDEVEGNEKLRSAYHHCRPGPVWREEAIELPNGVRIEALGKGGKIRGRRHRQYRPTLIILDDPQSFDDAYSETQMEKDYHWLMSDVMKAGDPNTNFLVLGTALADACIVCKLEKTPGWQFKRYQSIITEPTNMHLWLQWREMLWRHEDPQRDEKAQAWYLQNQVMMDEGHKVLWPERFPIVDLMKRRYSEGERAFQSEEQGIPMPPGDAEFGIHLFDYDGFWFEEWPTGNLLELYALDPSKGKESKAGDYQAFCRLVVDRYFRMYVEFWMEKMNIQELCEYIVDLYRSAPGEAVVVESNGFQELLDIPLRNAAKVHALDLPIFATVNNVAKPVRIRRLAGPLELREIRFKRSRGTVLAVDQLKAFRHPAPAGQHDDGPDVLETAVRIAKKLWNRKAAT